MRSEDKALVLIVDDNPQNLQVLGNMLRENGYKVAVAQNGALALKYVAQRRPACILLDVMMPEMDGFETCRRLKAQLSTADIPVIFITALVSIQDKLNAFGVGGVDYITKPFQAEEVLARVSTHLRIQELQRDLQERNILLQEEIVERKKLHEALERNMADLEREKQKTDTLLLNILPQEIAEELKHTNKVEPKYFESVSVMFTDFVGFTKIAEKLTPRELIAALDQYFSFFDTVVEKYQLEKLKTIGDSYMCAGGVPVPNTTHAVDVVMAALDMQAFFVRQQQQMRLQRDLCCFDMRIGINSGPLMAGVVGKKKFVYDVWGDTVNLAARLESSGESGKVNISRHTYELVKEYFECEYRGKITAKNKGEIDMYFVHAVKKA